MEEKASEPGLLGEAAARATASVPVAARADSVGEVRSSLVGRSFESIHEVAVLDGHRLGPLATIAQDLLSIAVYLAIATSIAV